MRSHVIFSAWLVSIAAAEPQTRYGNFGDRFCSGVKKIVTAFREQTAASPYCISYLKLQATTITITDTVKATATVVASTSTTVTTITVAPSPGPCRAEPIAVEGDPSSLEKRQRIHAAPPRYVPKPKCFGSFNGNAVISSACRCIVTTSTVVTRVKTTKTVATQMSTSVDTQTSTITEGSLPLPTLPSSFRIRAIEPQPDTRGNPPQFDGNYIGEPVDLGRYLDLRFVVSGTSPADAILFRLDTATSALAIASGQPPVPFPSTPQPACHVHMALWNPP